MIQVEDIIVGRIHIQEEEEKPCIRCFGSFAIDDVEAYNSNKSEPLDLNDKPYIGLIVSENSDASRVLDVSKEFLDGEEPFMIILGEDCRKKVTTCDFDIFVNALKDKYDEFKGVYENRLVLVKKGLLK